MHKGAASSHVPAYFPRQSIKGSLRRATPALDPLSRNASVTSPYPLKFQKRPLSVLAHPLSCLPSLTRLSYSTLFKRPPATFRLWGGVPALSNLRLWIISNPVWPWGALAAHQYYEGSDSCSPSLRLTGLPAYLTQTSQRSASNHVTAPNIALHANSSVSDVFQASPSPSQLADTPRRIEFVLLRTANSLPVALHPTSR